MVGLSHIEKQNDQQLFLVQTIALPIGFQKFSFSKSVLA